jgi:hypothetical protein
MGFMTGRKIYENFTNGKGPNGLSDGAAIVNEVAAMYSDRAEAIRRLTEKMESAWRGDAAGAAQRGIGPLGVEHDLAGMDLATAQDLTNRQAGSFADARNAVVPVPPEPTAPDPWAVFKSPGEVVTYRQQVADFNAASQHNVDVMHGYAGASSYNAQGMPQSYGALADDQAGIAVASGPSDTGGRPQDGGPKPDDGARTGGRGVAEWADDSSRWVAPPSDAGGPSGPSSAAPPDGGSPPPQQTTPGGFAPAPGGPVAPAPVGTGGGVGSGPLPGGPGSGWSPGPGVVPVGGGPGDGSGGRGPGGGPGGRGIGGPGSGSDSEVRGPGGRSGGGEPHGPGGRLGSGPLAGGGSAEPHAAGRAGAGGAAGRGGGLGGMPMAGGGRGRGDEDTERYAPEFLQEDDPEGVFGTDELTAPPVIGEEFEPPEPEESPSAG